MRITGNVDDIGELLATRRARLSPAQAGLPAFGRTRRIPGLRRFPDWETNMRDAGAALRGEAGRNPYHRGLSDLVGLLSTRSEEFRTEWARHDGCFHRSGTKRMYQPLVGDLTLAYERLELPADPELAIVTYSAEPGSPSEQRLRDLAGWAGTRARLATGRSAV